MGVRVGGVCVCERLRPPVTASQSERERDVWCEWERRRKQEGVERD